MTSKRVSSGVGGSSTGGASSAIAIQVFDHVYCGLFYVNYNFRIVIGSVIICSICDYRIDLCLYMFFIVMLVRPPPLNKARILTL